MMAHAEGGISQMEYLRRFCAVLLLLAIAWIASVITTPAQAQVAIFIYKSQPSLPRTGDYSAIHSVAIISAIGDRLDLVKSDFFGDKSATIDIADWQIDDYAAQAVKAYFGKRFEYESLAYDRQAIAKIPNGGLASSLPQLRAELQKLPPSRVDGYIVLRPNQDFDDKSAPQGLSLTDPDPDRLPAVNANFEIDIVDAKSLNVLGRASSRVRLREGAEAVFASFVGSRRLKLDDGLKLNENQRTELRSTMRGLLRYSILETVRTLKPDSAIPPVGARVFAQRTAEETTYPDIHKVAVVSAIGDRLELKADSFIGYDTAEIPIADWGADRQLEDDVRASLPKRIGVVDISFDRNEVAKSQLLDSDGKFAPKFLGLQPSSAVDAYIVMLKLARQINISSPRMKGSGIGLWKPPAKVIGTTPPAVYANYAMALIDAKTLMPIRVQAATVGPQYPFGFPYAPGTDDLWPKKLTEPTSDQIQKIQQTLSRLLNDSAKESLLALGLSDQKISDELPTIDGSENR
jgi:hypothetical protein